MLNRILLLCLAIVFSCGLSAQNRTTERAKNRAERRTNQKVDQKVDQAVDEAFDAVGNLFKKKPKKTKETDAKTNGSANQKVEDGGLVPNNGEEYTDEAEANRAVENAMGTDDSAFVPFSNDQPFSLTMSVTEIKKNGKENVSVIKMAVSESLFGMDISSDQLEEGSSRMIFNSQDGKTTVITTDKKGQTSGFRMKVPRLGKTVEQTAEDMEGRFTIVRTGETRVIDGYTCEKYVITDTKKNTTTDSWVTDEVGMDAQDIWSSFSKMAGAGPAAKSPNLQGLQGSYSGFPIESTTTDGKSTFTMTMRDIKMGAAKMDKSVLNTDGVQVVDMGF